MRSINKQMLGILLYASRSMASDAAFQRRLEQISENVAAIEQYFRQPLIRSLRILSQSNYNIGYSPRPPWTGSALPTYKDSGNWHWNPSDLSAVEKYAIVFGLNPQQLSDVVSRHSGVDSVAYNPPCRTHQDCMAYPSMNMCGIRPGRISGHCVADWAGSCDNLALVSVSEPEPICPVTVKNVIFQPFDIKILLTLLYKDLRYQTIAAGNRNDDLNPPQVDWSGRPLSFSFRDIDAGFFHLMLLNVLNTFQYPLIFDTLAGGQVMNAAVRDYQIKDFRQVDPTMVAQTVYKTPQYTYNAAMRYLYYVKTVVNYVYAQEEPLQAIPAMLNLNSHSWTYEYYLEVDENENIIGGEWHGSSMVNHPDIVWIGKQVDKRGMVSSDGFSYDNLKRILTASVACSGTLML